MNAARWKEVERVVDVALESDPGDWPTILHDRCGDDLELRQEVEALLARYAAARRFLDVPPLAAAAALVAEARTHRAGSLIGLTLVDRYQVVREIGRGGMATVYLVRDQRHGRDVALKVLSPELATTVRRGRFLREIEIAARLTHPHILGVHDSGDADGLLFYVMPYVEGETLRARLAQGGALPVPDALLILRDVAEALAYAHAHGVVHRDVKPDNIMLVARHALVADFGVAKAIHEATAGLGIVTGSGVSMGTPAYMAPEQALGDPNVDHRADLYALGVVAYEMLSGRLPFADRTPQELLAAQVTDEPESLEHCRADLSPDLAQLVMKCLAKKPADRWQSADEIVQRLETEVTTPIDSRAARPASPSSPAAVESGTRRRRRWLGAVALLAVVSVAGAVYGIREARVAPAPVARSVGVLPFVNMSAEPENAYFSDGLSEQIIAELSRIDGLRVAARTSSFVLRDRKLDVRAIGDTLGVAAVLEGSVRKDGNRLRVTAQLIDAATGYHIWSDEYNRDLEDIFAVQEQIARAIAGALDLRLASGGEATRASRMPDLEAYDLYLRGLYLRNSLTADALRQAMEYFDRAIELEPGFAPAYAAKASVVAPGIYFGHVPQEAGVRELRALTARALELDPTLGAAHAALGILRLFFEWDWKGAERALRRAIELNPSDPHSYHQLANFLNAMGRYAEAIAARERALELDPLNARMRILLGGDYYHARDYDRALAEYRRAYQLDPVNPLALGLGPSMPMGPARVYLSQGRYDEAIEEYIRIATLRGATSSEVVAMRSAYGASGMRGFWRSWLDMDMRQSGRRPDPLRAANLWALIGDTAQTFHWLDRAYAERNPGMIHLRFEPAFENLRSHPRVARILREMRLPAGER